MSSISAERITLTGSQRRELVRMVRAGRTERRLVERATIVLSAAEGLPNARVAASLGIGQLFGAVPGIVGGRHEYQ